MNNSGEVLDYVGKVIVRINEAKNVDQVILALHSLAVRLFPLDFRAFLGSIDKQYADEVIETEVPSVHERENWWQTFYKSTAFLTMARVLLLDVALNWLTCFPISAKKHLYDVFFLRGIVSEVVQTLVPYLQHHSNGRLEASICSNTERILGLCLLENDGVLQLTREFSHKSEDINLEQHKSAISRVAQLVTSVPDKARLGASTLLSSHLYVKKITIQLIQGAEEWEKKHYNESTNLTRSDLDGSILLIGDVFARICRRGSTDVLLSEVIPRVLIQVRSLLQPGSDLTVAEAFKLKPGLQFWSKIMEAIKDSYAVERICEQLLQKLASRNINDIEGYWILWLLFHQIYELQASIRSIFTERFLLWKVFPVCCLRWILQFSVLGCPPDAVLQVKSQNQNRCNLLDTTKRLLAVWSKQDFVQSAPVEQQAYLTAAVGLSLEKLKKEDLDATKDAMHLILQGVSCRLESPSHLVRKMASSVALVFSKVVNPNNPLYLDDTCTDETIDWEFTSTNTDREGKEIDINQEKDDVTTVLEKANEDTKNKNRHRGLIELTLVDPDEVIDPATLNNDDDSDGEFDDDSEISETSSESSLQPYDLTDDDTDLKKNFAQLVDVVGALRKSDDADGVTVGLSLEKLKKEDLDATKDAMHLILQGVSCISRRLESPSHLVRKMASSVALVFSKVVNPNNPLYLDDTCTDETIDWEFTSTNTDREGKEIDINQEKDDVTTVLEKANEDTKNKNRHRGLIELTLVDPDEVIDPATLNNDDDSDGEFDDDSEISETSSESSLQPYDLTDDDTDLKKNFAQLVDVVGALRKSDDADGVERALDVAEKLIRASPDELPFIASDLVRTLVQVRCSDSSLEGEEESDEEKRQKSLIALLVNCPLGSLDPINKLLYSANVDSSQRILILDVMTDAALELAHAKTSRQKHQSKPQIWTTAETQPWFLPSSVGPAGATVWKEISGTESPLSLTHAYERDLPSKPGQERRGKSRRWGRKLTNVVDSNEVEWSQNKFPPFAAAFMLPAMQGFDKRSHGVDFLGRDFIVLGKLIHMLGTCMKCSAMHPEASALALPLLDMLSSREVSHHPEAYVRKSVLFAASCILLALNPTYVASALVEGNTEISRGLEWVRTWALSITESDTDKECYMMAMACLQLHSEMALQTSRALESSDNKLPSGRCCKFSWKPLRRCCTAARMFVTFGAAAVHMKLHDGYRLRVISYA
nr:hypothetical protein [Tanacetum cinerariifolium]